MSEAFLSQPIETQTWQRELPLHHELDGRLKPDEAFALTGSFTETSLEGHRQEYETGELNEQSYGVKQRIHTAALEQLATLTVDDGSVLDVIVDRREEVEATLKAPHGGTRSRAEELALREQLEGVKLLNKMYLNVEDTIANYAQTQPGDGNRLNPRNRAAAINEVITRHNEQVARGPETIADIPDNQEAQPRTDGRDTEQPAQAEPIVTVAGARQKIAEAFGNTGEKDQEALIGEVAKAAKGKTRILTDIPKGAVLKSNAGDFRPRDGFQAFGDGLPQENHHNNTLLMYGGSAEAMLFAPDTTTRYKTVMKTVETGGRFFKKAEQVPEQVPDGEIPTMVINPSTGQQEPGIKVAYQFNGNKRKENGQTVLYEGPDYITESGRVGNQLFVEATLPRSVADELKQGVASNPEIAREFARTLAMSNGITEQAWNNGVRPPYDQVPNSWEMTVADLQLNQYRYHDVVARQAIRVNR
jgi:hypothetical protein